MTPFMHLTLHGTQRRICINPALVACVIEDTDFTAVVLSDGLIYHVEQPYMAVLAQTPGDGKAERT